MTMFARSLALGSTLLLSSLLGGCGDVTPVDVAPEATAKDQVSAKGLSLEVAKSLAAGLSQSNLRDALRSRLLAAPRHQVALSELSDLLVNHLPKGADLASLQIGAPVDFPEGVDPVVTFVPELAEDEVSELVYFSKDGKSFTLAVDKKPEAPVLVVGPREVTPKATELPKGGIAPLATKRLFVGQVLIRDDHEPWYKGDPEIYALCTFPASGSPRLILDLPGVNSTNAIYTINQTLGYYSDTYGTPARCGLFESDGITDGNDSLGTKQIWFSSPYGTHSISDGWFTFAP